MYVRELKKNLAEERTVLLEGIFHFQYGVAVCAQRLEVQEMGTFVLTTLSLPHFCFIVHNHYHQTRHMRAA